MTVCLPISLTPLMSDMTLPCLPNLPAPPPLRTHHNFNARQFWAELVLFRKKRLPMGCGTSTSQGGIVGGHAESPRLYFFVLCIRVVNMKSR